SDSLLYSRSSFFLFTYSAIAVIYSLSLHDALPISSPSLSVASKISFSASNMALSELLLWLESELESQSELSSESLSCPSSFESEDRKSTRLNSSHVKISYAVFCLKKKKDENTDEHN